MSLTPEKLLAAGKSNDQNLELVWKRLDCTPSSKMLLDKIQEDIDFVKRKENLKTQFDSMSDCEKKELFARLKSENSKQIAASDLQITASIIGFIFMFLIFICGLAILVGFFSRFF